MKAFSRHKVETSRYFINFKRPFNITPFPFFILHLLYEIFSLALKIKGINLNWPQKLTTPFTCSLETTLVNKVQRESSSVSCSGWKHKISNKNYMTLRIRTSKNITLKELVARIILYRHLFPLSI